MSHSAQKNQPVREPSDGRRSPVMDHQELIEALARDIKLGQKNLNRMWDEIFPFITSVIGLVSAQDIPRHWSVGMEHSFYGKKCGWAIILVDRKPTFNISWLRRGDSWLDFRKPKEFRCSMKDIEDVHGSLPDFLDMMITFFPSLTAKLEVFERAAEYKFN